MAKTKTTRKSPPAKNNRTIIIVTLGLVALVALGFMVNGLINTGRDASNGVNAQLVGNEQVINMKVTAAGYEPNYIVVKKGVPVKIVTDSTADAGCVRGFMMPDLGVPNKPLLEGKDEITFTPDKAGEYTFTCQMKMSSGKVKVVES